MRTSKLSPWFRGSLQLEALPNVVILMGLRAYRAYRAMELVGLNPKP